MPRYITPWRFIACDVISYHALHALFTKPCSHHAMQSSVMSRSVFPLPRFIIHFYWIVPFLFYSYLPTLSYIFFPLFPSPLPSYLLSPLATPFFSFLVSIPRWWGEVITAASRMEISLSVIPCKIRTEFRAADPLLSFLSFFLPFSTVPSDSTLLSFFTFPSPLIPYLYRSLLVFTSLLFFFAYKGFGAWDGWPSKWVQHQHLPSLWRHDQSYRSESSIINT